ncbi:MAG: hypothetical protein V3V91_08975 [Thermoplasmata archaeon]
MPRTDDATQWARYPIFVPSKGRADDPKTARMFDRDGIPYRIVVQPDQVEAYEEWADRGILLTLPEDDKGLVYARNWIKDFATKEGHERHWQFDDDVIWLGKLHRGYRIQCHAGVAVAACEDFVDRYENVALASMNAQMFLICNGTSSINIPPFYLNARCYTVFLISNSIPNRWRYRYNEDTDMTLQVLADGWCTILFNTFFMHTPGTLMNATGAGGKSGGGQSGVYAGDGRLKMARELERVWPGVVKTTRRFQRPQHTVKSNWKKFDTPLVRRKDPPPIRRYEVSLVAVEEPKSDDMKALLSEAREAE